MHATAPSPHARPPASGLAARNAGDRAHLSASAPLQAHAPVKPPRTIRLRAIEQFIDQNIDQRLRITQLAALAGMSRYYFVRCFKQETGLSPFQYVIVKRVERAQDLLEDDSATIAEVAYATGFSSQSHLNAVFKRHLGITPGSFRRARRA